MNEAQCVLPWMHLFVDSFGYFYNCCFGIAEQAYSYDESGQIIKASEPGAILRHWNSKRMVELRKGMIAGEKVSACSGCWRVEETGSASFRATANSEYPMDETTLSMTDPAPIFRYIDLRFGNLCNLACRMCAPYSSRKLSPEFAQLYGAKSVEPFQNMNWFESPHFWDELHAHRHQIEKIHLVGGEPLIIKECWEFLRRLSEDDCAKNITLSYNTNLSHIPPQAKEIWPRFKGVVLLVSMDGVGALNDFIRYPLKWEDFERNLKFIEENFEDLNVVNCHVQPTIQAYNIHHIVEICEYLAGFQKIKRYPLVNLLFDPAYLTPHVLPHQYREEISKKISDYTDEVELGRNDLDPWANLSLVRSLRGIITYINSEDRPELFREFQRVNDLFDVNRGQKILEFIPEFLPIYGK